MAVFTPEINPYLFGGVSADYLVAALFWLLLGISVVKIFRYQRRNKGTSARRQGSFSFWYWVKDNISGITLHVLVALITLRFPSEISELIKSFTGIDWFTDKDEMWVYLMLGLLFQTILDILQKITRGNIKTNLKKLFKRK